MTEVILERVPRRTFAAALDWPGWARSDRTEEAALARLADYAERYAPVASRAGVPFDPGELTVVETLAGDASTDFGVLAAVAAADSRPLTGADAGRQAALVEAAWAVFADVVAGAPAELRKGPRGGGRDRDKIVAHVVEAEGSYARKLGVKMKIPAGAGLDDAAELRAAVLAVLRQASDGSAVLPKGWPPRYAARRFAWHVLDHAWEIEDRSDLGAEP